jgi:CDP-paratose 2-epimerase
METIIVTGSNGLIGSETCRFFAKLGYQIVGIDNDMRAYFFGTDASTRSQKQKLMEEIPTYIQKDVDIRNMDDIDKIFSIYKSNIKLVVHCAAQPSHDWACKEPLTDFGINATGTLNMLEATRKYCPEAVFIFTSTNKVYGDTPNNLPLVELEKRWEIDSSHPFFKEGIDESMSIDQTTHSVFGASKVAADVMVQEYGKYFGMNTCVMRGGCLCGPAHKGAELHGFLAYLIKCAVSNKPYTVFGYKAKQVRDNIHSYDLVNAFYHFFKNPRKGEVYNMGGSRHSNISMLEAIDKIEQIAGYKVNYTVSDTPRIGDHIWYISDVSKFKSHYPDWNYMYDIDTILADMIKAAENKN